ncbi:hypothetical protein C2S51_017038 [Perilla frutescens var. frutescens]|nr:hypothetical protein C2S51_017038 [Perilla frutescens var. frutescens]
MVGFEFRNGRSVPLFEGIVVCAEFKDAILAAYVEEEERRGAEEKRKTEAQALSRWYQLLSSIITRQRLNTLYGDGAILQSTDEIPKPSDECSKSATISQKRKASLSPGRQQVKSTEKHDVSPSMPTKDHEHEFIMEEQEPGLIQVIPSMKYGKHVVISHKVEAQVLGICLEKYCASVKRLKMGTKYSTIIDTVVAVKDSGFKHRMQFMCLQT